MLRYYSHSPLLWADYLVDSEVVCYSWGPCITMQWVRVGNDLVYPNVPNFNPSIVLNWGDRDIRTVRETSHPQKKKYGWYCLLPHYFCWFRNINYNSINLFYSVIAHSARSACNVVKWWFFLVSIERSNNKLAIFVVFQDGYIDREEFTRCWNQWIKTVSILCKLGTLDKIVANLRKSSKIYIFSDT